MWTDLHFLCHEYRVLHACCFSFLLLQRIREPTSLSIKLLHVRLFHKNKSLDIKRLDWLSLKSRHVFTDYPPAMKSSPNSCPLLYLVIVDRIAKVPDMMLAKYCFFFVWIRNWRSFWSPGTSHSTSSLHSLDGILSMTISGCSSLTL